SEKVFAQAGFNGVSMADLARAAGLPKPNLHYYFGNKEGLYRAVLANIMSVWISATDPILPENDPAEALTEYVRSKIALSKNRPHASRVFANEILNGAPQLRSFLGNDLRALVKEKTRVFDHWAERGLMQKVNAPHLLFALWAMTQTYADFEAQIGAVLGVAKMGDAIYDDGAETIIRLVLQGCGVKSRPTPRRRAAARKTSASRP
ncbi:MAG TPA: TetR/AcrR family transcriptional regulator, partial [Reyranella sp.]|nr:TetR/AcrR family transcriptional regulator [Reyranella sp.]